MSENLAANLSEFELPLPETTANRRRHRFVLEYVIDLNGAAAAVRAGYSRSKAGGRASELLRRPDVQTMIRAELQHRDERTRVTGDRVVRELARIAFADPSRIAKWGPDGVELVHSDDMTEDDKAAVKWISVGGRKGARAQRFEMHDKLAALEILARMTGVLTRGGGKGRSAMLAESDDERAARLEEQAAARVKLAKLIEGKAQYLAEQKFAAMVAARDESDDEKKPDSNDG